MRLIVVPLGGGGLVAASAGLGASPALGVGVQAEAARLHRLAGGLPAASALANTICDGIAVKRPGEVTLPARGAHVDEIVTVTDDEVAEAMVLLLERSKLVVEGAGAVGVAALLHGRVEPAADGRRVRGALGRQRGRLAAGRVHPPGRDRGAARRMVLSTKVPDRPGGLARLLDLVAEHGANVMDVEHLREGIDLHVRETAIQLVIQTRGPEHGDEILAAARAEGFPVRWSGRSSSPRGARPRRCGRRVSTEGAVVALRVLGAGAGRAVVAAARRQCRGVEDVHLLPAVGREGDVDRAGPVVGRDREVVRFLEAEGHFACLVAPRAALLEAQRRQRARVEDIVALIVSGGTARKARFDLVGLRASGLEGPVSAIKSPSGLRVKREREAKRAETIALRPIASPRPLALRQDDLSTWFGECAEPGIQLF